MGRACSTYKKSDLKKNVSWKIPENNTFRIIQNGFEGGGLMLLTIGWTLYKIGINGKLT